MPLRACNLLGAPLPGDMHVDTGTRHGVCKLRGVIITDSSVMALTIYASFRFSLLGQR
jgi:hypothetical protein